MTRTTFGRILPTGSKGGGVGIMAGFNVNEELTVGYSFDYSVGNSTFKYNGGSLLSPTPPGVPVTMTSPIFKQLNDEQ